jgi:hypothetical protein
MNSPGGLILLVSASPPAPGQLVRLRQRRWLVEKSEPPARGGDATLVFAASVDDDAQGDSAVVLREHELDARPR